MASEWTKYSSPDPEWEKVVETQLGGKAPDLADHGSISALRQWRPSGKPHDTLENAPAEIRETLHMIPVRDGEEITVKTYQPASPSNNPAPLIVVFHGGGWSVGGLEYEEENCRTFTREFGAVVCNVEYRLAPEYKFPTAAFDAIDATKWAAKNASSLGADPSTGFILSGNSAGGNLVCIVAHTWRDEGLSPPITGCDYRVPVLIWHSHVPAKWKADYRAWEQNSAGPVLSAKLMTMFADAYCPDEDARGDPMFGPLLWPSGHGDLPPSTFQVCGLDPLRDDALIFERCLREEHGVKTRLKIYPGLPHGFGMVAPQMEALQMWSEDLTAHMGWLMEQAWS